MFYKGEVAKRDRREVEGARRSDDARRSGELQRRVGDAGVDDLSRPVHDVYATRAPSQAWGIVETMNVLEACVPTWYPGQTLATLGPANPLYWHALIEAKKVVYADVYSRNADPNAVSVPLEMLTSKAHAGVAVRQGRSDARVQHRLAELRRDRCRRHDLSRRRGPLGKHGVVDQQQFRRLGIGHHRAGLRIHPPQPRRPVHAGSRTARTSSRRTSARTTRCRRCW